MNESFSLEICIDSIESAINAIEGGANRLEVCSSLRDDGLTPTLGLIESIDRYLKNNFLKHKVNLYAMIRPRAGDFVYSENEILQMSVDMYHIKKLNAIEGFVFGALKTDGNLDENTCKKLLNDHYDMENTFHRAIDVSKDPYKMLESIIRLGFKRVLTSGHALTALDGVNVIKQMIELNQGRIRLCIGAGITDKNLNELILKLDKKINEFHGSAKILKKSKMKDSRNTTKLDYYITSQEIVSKMVEIGEKNFKL